MHICTQRSTTLVRLVYTPLLRGKGVVRKTSSASHFPERESLLYPYGPHLADSSQGLKIMTRVAGTAIFCVRGAAPALFRTRPGKRKQLRCLRSAAPALHRTRPGKRKQLRCLRSAAPALYRTRPGKRKQLRCLRSAAPALHRTRPGKRQQLRCLRSAAPALYRTRSGKRKQLRCLRSAAPALYRTWPGKRKQLRCLRSAALQRCTEHGPVNASSCVACAVYGRRKFVLYCDQWKRLRSLCSRLERNNEILINFICINNCKN